MVEGEGLVAARVIPGHRDPTTMVGFQWTGAEPAELDEPDLGEALGRYGRAMSW
jgi:hypothetical protein